MFGTERSSKSVEANVFQWGGIEKYLTKPSPRGCNHPRDTVTKITGFFNRDTCIIAGSDFRTWAEHYRNCLIPNWSTFISYSFMTVFKVSDLNSCMVQESLYKHEALHTHETKSWPWYLWFYSILCGGFITKLILCSLHINILLEYEFRI